MYTHIYTCEFLYIWKCLGPILYIYRTPLFHTLGMKYLFRTRAHPPTAPGASRSEVSVFFSHARRFFLHSGFHPVPRTLRARLASSWGSASREQSATRLPLAGVRDPSVESWNRCRRAAARLLPPDYAPQTVSSARTPRCITWWSWQKARCVPFCLTQRWALLLLYV